jgi:predicted nucleic acid-binding protein
MLVDAGPPVAAASRSDRNHERCVRLLSRAPRPLLVPALVVTEVACFLADRLGAEAERAFATWFAPPVSAGRSTRSCDRPLSAPGAGAVRARSRRP